jgi:hypothetical protein
MALTVANAPPPDGHRVRVRLGAPASPLDPAQTSLGAPPWRLGAGPARPVLERLEHEHPRLGDRFRCQLGVKTGLNQVFLDPGLDVEAHLLRWALRGRDVKPFRAEPRQRLLWPCDESGRALPVLPSGAARAIAPHLGVLRRRADHDGGVPWTLFRTGPASAPHRVVWSDLARRLTAVALTGPADRHIIPLNTCYVIAVSDGPTALRLAGWLNCTWVRVIAAASAEPASGGFSRFNARVMSALPLPTAALASHDLLVHARAGAGATLRQSDLDDCCAGLLGITARERTVLAGLAPPDRHAGCRTSDRCP